MSASFFLGYNVQSMSGDNWANEVRRDGYSVVANAVTDDDIAELERAISQELSTGGRAHGGDIFAYRNILQHSPTIAALAERPSARRWIEPILGKRARAVRGILFNKTDGANWLVPWHQDLTIAVDVKREVEGYGAWSVKSGVVHVQPPVAVLESMLTIRISLDDCNMTNGPLRVIAGSHQHGVFRHSEIGEIVAQQPVVDCVVARGGAVIMRPLLLHSSKPKTSNLPRRVLHIEYASCELVDGLNWAVQ